MAGALLAGWLLLARRAPRQPQAAGIPRRADGKPDFSGIWQSTERRRLRPRAARGPRRRAARRRRRRRRRAPVPTVGARAARANFDAARDGRPHAAQVLHARRAARGLLSRRRSRSSSGRATSRWSAQFGAVRTIHTNGTHHPEGPFGFWLGDSRAHWDGDTLVVDVVDFNAETWLDRAGNFHSEALHVVERWTLLDANTIAYAATVEDPEGVHAAVDARTRAAAPPSRARISSSSRTTASRTNTTQFYPFRDDERAAPPDDARTSSSARQVSRAIEIETRVLKPRRSPRRSRRCRARCRRRAAGRTTVARVERGEWNGPRLPDGQPDIEGHWSNTIGNHDNFTDPQGGIPGDVARAGGGGARAIGTVERAHGARAEPRDAIRPTARCRSSRGRAPCRRTCSRTSSTRPSEQYIEPLARCAPAGPDEVVDVARLRDSPVPGLRAVPVRLRHAHRPPRRQAALAGARSSSGTATRAAAGKATRSSSTCATTTARRGSRARASSRARTCAIEERYIFAERRRALRLRSRRTPIRRSTRGRGR